MSVVDNTRSMMGRVRNFVREIWAELGKVAWPTRQQLWSSTRVVLVSTAILAVYIGLCDFLASYVIRFIAR